MGIVKIDYMLFTEYQRNTQFEYFIKEKKSVFLKNQVPLYFLSFFNIRFSD